MSEVERWRSQCDSVVLPAIDALRALILRAGDGVTESIKWNAPSFAQHGRDRITLGIERKGGVRAVLHRGAAKTDDDFHFNDPDNLAQWPASDRGILTFADEKAIAANETRIAALFRRWLEATS